jgi:hypothetical protein
LPATSQAKDNKKNHESGIIGQIEQIPGPWNIRITSRNGRFVEDIQANDSGAFEVELKAGTYILTPYILSIDGKAELVGASTLVVVHKKEFTTTELPILIGPSMPTVNESM